jgi:hydrogenase maturation protein HypF
MRRFALCEPCRAEYEDPADRRFHAQPIACPACGPRLELWDMAGSVRAAGDDALRAAADLLRRGGIAAVKGLGGFQLLVDARDQEAVSRLRRRKVREEKPLALLFPGLPLLQEHCEVSAAERDLLLSPQAPIVLLRRRGSPAPSSVRVADAVAPRNPYLGCMLPYTPLHHLLLAELSFPVVATSGNRSDEPICTDEREALVRLNGIADVFLVHDRPIARPVDDSVARITLGRELLLRRARGYAPLPVLVTGPLPPVLATGAHLKNTVAVTGGRQVCLSQHIGDLETLPALDAFRRAAADLPRLLDVTPRVVACDAHPDYFSTRFAEGLDLPVVRIQHHHAHVLACLADNELTGRVLGVAWDGTGHGADGTAWGGEFLLVEGADFRRVAYFRPFRLPGGDKAAREPRRTALGVLHELFGDGLFDREGLAPLAAFSAAELRVLRGMLAGGVHSPLTSSAGRLFDAVASLVDLRQVSRYEGQAAMELEFCLEGAEVTESYPFDIDSDGVIDWRPAMRAVLSEREVGVATGRIAARFHNTLAEAIAAVAWRVREERVVLTGGCFQNTYLLGRAVHRLREEGFQVFWHRRVPPNDGGVALGQAVAACLRGQV